MTVQAYEQTPGVEVVQIAFDTDLRQVLGSDGVPLAIDLGDAQASSNLTQILAAMRARAVSTFLLRWKGSRVPRGAKVGEHILTWTQHGMACSDSGIIGTYDHLIDTAETQVMLVHVFNKK